jgi:hypothetical protein
MDSREWGRWWRLVGHAGLNHVLSTDWDPLGVSADAPLGEYDRVTGLVAGLLRSGAKPDQIADILTEYRIRQLEVDPDPVADRLAAERLVTWYQAAMAHARRRDTHAR